MNEQIVGTDVETKVVLSSGEEIGLEFPSLRKIKRLSELLGVDIFTDGLKHINYSTILLDEKKSVEIMKLCLRENVGSDFLDKITPSDFDLIVTAFFFKGKTASVNLTGELNVLRNFTDPGAQLYHLLDTPSMLQSSPHQTESPIG